MTLPDPATYKVLINGYAIATISYSLNRECDNFLVLLVELLLGRAGMSPLFLFAAGIVLCMDPVIGAKQQAPDTSVMKEISSNPPPRARPRGCTTVEDGSRMIMTGDVKNASACLRWLLSRSKDDVEKISIGGLLTQAQIGLGKPRRAVRL